MKKVFMIMMCLLALLVTSKSADAQEIVIGLDPGWNWISYTNTEPMQIGDALGSFVPNEGDMIQSQFSNTKYINGRWRGTLAYFMPGRGYKYFSSRTEYVEFVFSTPPMPTGTLTVTTSEPTNVTSTTAACGGSAVSNDGTTILMKGVCWATNPQPTTNDSYLEVESGPGTFTAAITGLAQETVYYVRAYAVSVKGINYGEELSFTTVSPGILNGLFSVGENTQVCFSQGNLQYQASTNTWRFAENQWDYVGNSELGTVYENGVKCDNSLISSTYNGWIDLFCWGTGNDPTHVSPRPWDVFVDWGINPISNGGNCPNQWLTMSLEELLYLFSFRNTPSGIRFAKAVVNDINGIVLLPDDWQESYYTLNNPNSSNSSYASNTISLDDWASLESYGAVFFPAAGMRYGEIYDSGSVGQYWSCTDVYFDSRGYAMYFSDEGYSMGDYYKDFGQSVRLVQFVQTPSFNINATPNQEEYGSVDGGGVYELGQTCTLTAIPNEGYTFMNWKMDGVVVSTESTYSFAVRNNKNFVATFYENTTYPFTYSYNDNDHTATVTGHLDGQNATGDLVIPEAVMHNGETYTVTGIGSYAFNGCSGLTSVSIPNTMIFINNWAFRYCDGLTEVVIPSSVTSIGVNPFAECSNLAQITVGLGNAYYDSRDNCNAIIQTSTNCLISGSLSGIIPSSVTSLGQDAFYIESITSITSLAEIPPTINECSFCGVNNNIPVYVPCGSIEAYQNANGWNGFTNFIGVGQCSGVVTVTASPAEYGTVSGGGSFEGGEICTVTATPNEGYYFLCWMEDGQGVSTEATYTFPVYRDHDLTAIFYASIGDERVINGDFEQGNVGFTSAYQYNSNLFLEGTYYVDYNASLHHVNFVGLGHGGSGNYMIVNGAAILETNVWTEQITVIPNTYYVFSTWLCTVAEGSPALLQFSINGTQIGDVFTAPSQTNSWQQFSTIWYSGNSTAATITILNQNTENTGNDFGLDDISFREFDPSVSGGDHDYVDLGLPSGLLWATCNVGAETPEDYGDYFAWGETQPKDVYGWSTYQYCMGSSNTLTKYCDNASLGYDGFTDNLTTLLPEDDVATANWGNGWRMPTREEYWELYNNTTSIWTTQNGVNGCLFTASNGNSLFLPATGYRYESSLYGAGGSGWYWSSSLGMAYPYDAWRFGFEPGNDYMGDDLRGSGRSVRAVRSGQN